MRHWWLLCLRVPQCLALSSLLPPSQQLQNLACLLFQLLQRLRYDDPLVSLIVMSLMHMSIRSRIFRRHCFFALGYVQGLDHGEKPPNICK
jgi:hypothetical protein